jgi:hypothetical protein
MALRDIARPKRLIIAAILVAIPALITVLWRTAAPDDFDSFDTYNTLSAVLVYGFLLILLSVIFGTGVISQEIEQKTIVYMLTRPVPRWRIALIKFAAAVVGIVVTTWLSVLLLAFAAFGIGGESQSAVLRFSDVRDPAELVARVKDGNDELSKYFHERLSDRAKRWLSPEFEAQMANPPDPQKNPARARRRALRRPSQDRIQRVVISDINEVLRTDKDLYSAARFEGVELNGPTQALLAKHPSGRDLTRLNRLLLEQSYPDLIIPRKQPTFNLAKDLQILPLGAVAYGAVFLLLATLLQRPLMVGLVFAFGWESWVPNMPDKFQMVSIMTYLRTLSPHPRPAAESVDLIQFLSGSNQQTITTATAITVLFCIIAVGLGLALALFSSREYVPREDTE